MKVYTDESTGLGLHHIEKIVDDRKSLYSGAVIGLALSNRACHYGFIMFLGPNDTPPSNLLYDYPTYTIVRKYLSVEEAINLIKQLVENDVISGLIPEPIQLRLSQKKNPMLRIRSKDDEYGRYLKKAWPMLYLRSQLHTRTEQNKYLYAEGLPFFPSIDSAIRNLFNVKKANYSYGDSFEVLIPDYRLRLVSVTSEMNDILVQIENNLSQSQVIHCKIFASSKEKTYRMERVLKNDTVSFSLEEEPLHLYFLFVDDKDQELDYVRIDLQKDIPRWVIRIYSEQDLESLLDQGESIRLEYKLKIARGVHKEFLESVSAFANTDGGKILLGVDNNANIAGLDRYQNRRIENLISSRIEPEIPVIISNVEIDEKKVTIVEIPKGKDKDKPYVLKGHGPYKRVGSTDMIFSKWDFEKLRPIHFEVSYPDGDEYYR